MPTSPDFDNIIQMDDKKHDAAYYNPRHARRRPHSIRGTIRYILDSFFPERLKPKAYWAEIYNHHIVIAEGYISAARKLNDKAGDMMNYVWLEKDKSEPDQDVIQKYYNLIHDYTLRAFNFDKDADRHLKAANKAAKKEKKARG